MRPRLDLREDLAVLGEAVRSSLDAAALDAWGEAPEVPFPAGARLLAPVLAAAVVVTFALYMASVLTRTPFTRGFVPRVRLWLFLRIANARGDPHAVDAPARELALLATLLERLEREPVETPRSST